MTAPMGPAYRASKWRSCMADVRRYIDQARYWHGQGYHETARAYLSCARSTLGCARFWRVEYRRAVQS